VTGTGLELRPLRWVDGDVHPEDLTLVEEVYAAQEARLLGTRDTNRASLTTYLALPIVRREATVLLMRDERPVGHVFVMVDPHLREVFVDLPVVPGPAAESVLERALDHARETASAVVAGAAAEGAADPSAWTLRTSRWQADEVAARAYAAHGLERVRTWYRMRVDCSAPDVPASAPPLPDGVELVVRDDEETRRAIWSVDNEAFLDHWNFAPIPYEEWWADFSAGTTRDPDGWWLLRVDGEPAAFVILDETRAESGDGYVSVLGVRRQYRGRGLARWLLQAAFVRYRDLGRAGVQLSVDAENETGALRLYEGVGMSVQEVRESWTRPAANPDDSGSTRSAQ
jgi:ribosomal protein S18 acetylase RimI-like enzyme